MLVSLSLVLSIRLLCPSKYFPFFRMCHFYLSNDTTARIVGICCATFCIIFSHIVASNSINLQTARQCWVQCHCILCHCSLFLAKVGIRKIEGMHCVHIICGRIHPYPLCCIIRCNQSIRQSTCLLSSYWSAIIGHWCMCGGKCICMILRKIIKYLPFFKEKNVLITCLFVSTPPLSTRTFTKKLTIRLNWWSKHKRALLDQNCCQMKFWDLLDAVLWETLGAWRGELVLVPFSFHTIFSVSSSLRHPPFCLITRYITRTESSRVRKSQMQEEQLEVQHT